MVPAPKRMEVKLTGSSGLEPIKAPEIKQELEELEQVKRLYRTHRGLEIEITLRKKF